MKDLTAFIGGSVTTVGIYSGIESIVACLLQLNDESGILDYFLFGLQSIGNNSYICDCK